MSSPARDATSQTRPSSLWCSVPPCLSFWTWRRCCPRDRHTAAGRTVTSQIPKVVILGGGLTGISTALHLCRPWVLFEKEAQLGGLVVTRERDGYFFDRTGHWLHLRDDGMKHLVAETLPGQMAEVERRARIFSYQARMRVQSFGIATPRSLPIALKRSKKG